MYHVIVGQCLLHCLIKDSLSMCLYVTSFLVCLRLTYKVKHVFDEVSGRLAPRRALLNVTVTALSRDFSPTSTPTDAKKSHTPPGHRFNCDLGITLKPYRFHLFFKQ